MSEVIPYDWASVISRLLVESGSPYRAAGMFVEFQNVADPDAAVPAPPLDRADGITYYNDLSASADTDYLRVPLLSAVRSSTDPIRYPDGNQIVFHAQSQGFVGTHGKAFNAASNSKVYGGAIVSMPDQADRTKDLVIVRFYLAAADQTVKLAIGQIGLSYILTLE